MIIKEYVDVSKVARKLKNRLSNRDREFLHLEANAQGKNNNRKMKSRSKIFPYNNFQPLELSKLNLEMISAHHASDNESTFSIYFHRSRSKLTRSKSLFGSFWPRRRSMRPWPNFCSPENVQSAANCVPSRTSGSSPCIRILKYAGDGSAPEENKMNV